MDSIEITQKMRVRPFTVPNFVLPILPPGNRQEGFKETPGIPVGDLSDEVLNQLVDQFRRDLLSNAIRQRGNKP